MKSFLEKAENYPFSFLSGFTGLLSVIYVRNFLESSLEGNLVLGFSPLKANSFYSMFLHFPLFYISLYLWLILLLFLLTGERIERLARLLLWGMGVILIVPIIDHFLSHGAGYRLTYLKGAEEIHRLLDFFNLKRDIVQASPGQRVEILLAMAGAASYVYYKRKNPFRSLLAIPLTYLLIFLHGIYPNTVAKLLASLPTSKVSFGTILTGGIAGTDSQNYALLFTFSSLLAGWLLLIKSGKIKLPHLTSKALFLPLLFSASALFSLLSLRGIYKLALSNPINVLMVLGGALLLLIIYLSGNTEGESRTILAVPALFSGIALGPLYFAAAGLTALLIRRHRGLLIASFLSLFAGIGLVYGGKTHMIASRKGREIRAAELMAFDLFLEKDTRKALDLYERLAGHTGSEKYRIREAQCLVKLGHPRDALSQLEKLKDPGYEGYLTLGEVYDILGLRREASKIYLDASIKPYDPAGFLILGARTLARSGDREGFLKLIAEAEKHGIPPHIRHQILGDYYLRKGKLDPAKEEFRRSLSLYKRDEISLAGLGYAYYSEGEIDSALFYFERARILSPRDYALYNNIGACELKRGDLRGALHNFSRSLKINPSQYQGYFNIGLVYELAGDTLKAIRYYRRALNLNPLYEDAKRGLARLGGGD